MVAASLWLAKLGRDHSTRATRRVGGTTASQRLALPGLGRAARMRPAVNGVLETALSSPPWFARLEDDLTPRVNSQSEFNFGANGTEQGYSQWLAGRRMAAGELARRMNLPLGHQVEVWLYGGIRLRGTLRLREEMLFIEEERVRHLELVVDHVGFTYRDMESCVRLD